MKRTIQAGLVFLVFLGATTPVGEPASSRQLDDAKASLKRGAYREALESLNLVLAQTPQDPWAPLYRTLCEQRLKSAQALPQLSTGQWRTLEHQLKQEERDQHRSAAQQKTLERQLKKEQKRWDQELQTLDRQARQEEALKRQRAQTEAVAKAREERAKVRERIQQETVRQAAQAQAAPSSQPQAAQVPATASGAGSAPSPTPAAATAEAPTPAPAAVSGRSVPTAPSETVQPPSTDHAKSERPSVELAPVTVPTTAPIPAQEGEPVSPSLAKRSAPPRGAVEINARQMSVSPDRRIAVAEGDVEVVFENALLTCDHLTLFTDTKDAYAEGRVRLEQGDQIFRGEMVHYNFETKKGRFLQGTVSSPPWHEHGRSVEHLAEGVYEVTPGYLTSCELEPPHFKFYGRRAIVFADDRLARARNVALFVDQVPFLYLPWISVADRQTPFFLVPGKDKRWGEFGLMGYRYELPVPDHHHGTVKLDWRRFFGWAVGVDHQFESERLGRGLFKVYYNEEPNTQRKKEELPKGAGRDRYRLLWRHTWQPLPDTTVITNFQKYSDVDFRKELLFREEFSDDDLPESFVSLVKNTPDFSVTGLVRKRVNRFQTVTDALPDVTVTAPSKPLWEHAPFFSETSFRMANLQTKRAHSDNDTDVVLADWFQQFKYALALFRPVEVTPRMGLRETYYTKDKQGGLERPDGQRDLLSGQFSAGTDASLKLFRIFPVTTNAFGLNVNWLRHVLTPTLSYNYVHLPTIENSDLEFPAASGNANTLTFGLENKLQTKRSVGGGKPQSVDLARSTISVPYTFRSHSNKAGGTLGDWSFDVELFPWPWMRLESDWAYPSRFIRGSRDSRITRWNLDLVMVGGRGNPLAKNAPAFQAPEPKAFEPGPRGGTGFITPTGQWYLGLGHRYSQNDKTESVVQFNVGLSDKWEIRTFHRLTWKEVAGSTKRFNNVREYQYSLRRDLHDWLAEFVYRVDREFGEELFFTLTLKAYPEMPIELQDSYHEPKLGSQSSPFSPIAVHQ